MEDTHDQSIRTYQDLHAWQKSRALCLGIYRATEAFPDHERYGLIAQLRRCSVSVPSNIAEGYGRESPQDFLRFLRTSRGSLYELETQVTLSVDLGYLTPESAQPLFDSITEIRQILSGLIKSVRKRINSDP